MMPQDLRSIDTERSTDVRPGDDGFVPEEERRGGLGALIVALVLAAAVLFGVWYFVGADDSASTVPEAPDPAEAPGVVGQ